jgi:diaminopimelate epimerase
VKAHACGNDFLIVDAGAIADEEKKEAAVSLCSRNTGVGADGVEFLEWTGERSGRIRLFNSDGSIAEISGNGTRCVAASMAQEKRAASGDIFAIETDAGLRNCQIVAFREQEYEIATGMGIPEVRQCSVRLAGGAVVEGAAVSMGNPHFVTFVENDAFSVARMEWETVGREICFHSDFPQQTNVEFVRVIDTNEIEFRIFERGVGPTTSSGTGTCASAAAAIALRGFNRELLVRAQGGEQRVNWAGGSAQMILTGPAVLIATGEAF